VEVCDFFIFPERSERDRAIDRVRTASPETLKRILGELTPE